MGLLDSNIVKAYGLIKSSTILLSNNQSAFTPQSTYIDCTKYNTAVVEIVSYNGGVNLKFVGTTLSGNRTTETFGDGVFAFEHGELKDIKTFYTERSVYPRLLVVDVRDFSKLGVGRNDETTYGVDVKYALIQESLDVLEHKDFLNIINSLSSINEHIGNIDEKIEKKKEINTLEINGYSGPGNKKVNVPDWANYATIEFENLGDSKARLYATDKEHPNFEIMYPYIFNRFGYLLKQSHYEDLASFRDDIAFRVDGLTELSITSVYQPYFNNVTCIITFYEQVSDYLVSKIGLTAESKGLTKNCGIRTVFDNDKLTIYKSDYDTMGWISSAYNNIFTSFNANSGINVYLNGLDSEPIHVELNDTNFPGLISGSKIVRCVIVPAPDVDRYAWRINVITDKGQIYHNFPQRGSSETWPREENDAFLFEESVIWELKSRKTPVKTESGTDATLIATGCYKYNPLLPDSSYEFHPILNTDPNFVDTYNNGGFGATITKQNELGENVTFGRFYQPARDDEQDNSFDFMGGFAPDQKMTLIGTYRDNSHKQTRICVFATVDGGRNWYCIYEFGSHASLVNGSGELVSNPRVAKLKLLTNTTLSSLGSGKLSMKKRSSVVPSAADKEPSSLFVYGEAVSISSITPSSSNIRIVTASEHGLRDGDIIIFTKNSEDVTAWDFLCCGEHSSTSAGDGTKFCVRVINSTSFDLCLDVYNPFNPLPCRHIHSVDRNKDSFIISCGEMYPYGWIIWMDCWQSDSFTRIKPWDNLGFVRLTSTAISILRTLGTYVMQDKDNTVYVGIDNEYNIMYASLPEGRTDKLKRSSNGVWKGKLVDIDDQNEFTCILPSKEVAYLFKIINGIMIYIGQLGEVSVSTDYGESWTTAGVGTVDISRYGGISIDNLIVVQGFVIRVK